MKKIIIVGIAVIFLLFAACTTQTETKKNDISVIAQKYAPENSMIMLSFSSIEKLFSTFNLKPESVMGEPIVEDRTELINVLGFDPMNLTEYEKNGFETKKEFGFVMSNLSLDGNEVDKTQANFAFFVPLKENSKAFDFVKEKINANKTDKMIVGEKDGMITIQSTEEEGFLATIKADPEYLIFNFAINSIETASVFFTAGKHLADSPNYKEVSSSINMSSDIGFYLDFKSIVTKNEKSFQDLTLNPMFAQNELRSIDFLKFYRGFGVTLDLSKSDFIVQAVSFVDANSPLNKLISNVKLDKSVILGLEKKPAVLLAMMINVAEYLNFYLNSVPDEIKNEFESKLAETNQSLGIDIRKDIIDQLAGSINIGMYDGANINLMQYNTVVNFNIKNNPEFIKLLEKTKQLTGIIPVEKDQFETILGAKPKNEISLYSLNLGMYMAYILVENDNVSVITGKDLLTDIVNKDNATFISKLDKDIADKLQKDQNYLYIDIAETYLAAKNIYQFFVGMSGGENILDANSDNFANKITYLYTGGNYVGEKATGEFIIKTKFQKPFFIALQEELDKLNISK